MSFLKTIGKRNRQIGKKTYNLINNLRREVFEKRTAFRSLTLALCQNKQNFALTKRN